MPEYFYIISERVGKVFPLEMVLDSGQIWTAGKYSLCCVNLHTF